MIALTCAHKKPHCTGLLYVGFATPQPSQESMRALGNGFRMLYCRKGLGFLVVTE